MTPELFHRVAEEGSARVRRRMVELGLTERIRIRNVAYDNVRADLLAHGQGDGTPALWDGVTLHRGAEAVLAELERLAAE